MFNQLYESLPKRHRGFVQEHIPGGGPHGFAYADSLTTQLAVAGPVSVLFTGTLANNPTELEDAAYCLEEYRCANGGGTSAALPGGVSLDLVVQLEGPFAFIIHDRDHGRVLAARDAAAQQPLVWARCPRTASLVFASDAALLPPDCEDAEEFPAGAVFISGDHSLSGRLATFGAETLLEPALCRAESSTNLSGAVAAGGMLTTHGVV